jgi:tetratricopeptide (TPR) repeat protein
VLTICFLFSFIFNSYSEYQNENKEELFQRFFDLYSSGDLLNAERALIKFLESKDPLTNEQLSAGYNNLGVVNLTLGNYEKALEYNYKAENYLTKKETNTPGSADIFNNRGRILNIKKSFDQSVGYLEKSIRIYSKLETKDKLVLKNFSYAYINLSIACNETKKYALALQYLQKDIELNSKFNLSDFPLIYFNLAKTYVRMGNSDNAEFFYRKSISSFIKEYNNNYFRLAEVYFDYGLFLRQEGKITYALDAHKKSLAICLKNYGQKHSLVSLSYKHIGDDYISLNMVDSALFFYQKSLIAVDKSFENMDVFTNPSIDSSLFDLRLLDNLKSKAQALLLLAVEQNVPAMKQKTTAGSLEAMNLALNLIDRLRTNYMSEESKIYLAENEKETYLSAINIACNLFKLNQDTATAHQMYIIAQKAKAAILRNDITGNELLYSAGIPDSLRERQKTLTGNIAAYNNLLTEESRKSQPDMTKITLWKDALFDMNREKERVTASIEKVFPRFRDLIRKTEPLSLSYIQKHLGNNETIVDYLLSNKYTEGKRQLFVFLISSGKFDFRELYLDSLFSVNAEIISKTSGPRFAGSGNNEFGTYCGALNYMYLNLISPVEKLLERKKLIIIPDEEIGWLSFDAFLRKEPGPEQTDFEGLSYLINDYTFSYSYSSSLVFGKTGWNMKKVNVMAFSPEYDNSLTDKNSPAALHGASSEIGTVYTFFSGTRFISENATKSNFLSVLHDSAIFHLAMHSRSDSLNSRYSYLMFQTGNQPDETGKLYNYEISLSRIKSPMVVLSACNSGTGTLLYGEGMMSLARGFILAGASSVIKTAWEINDETSTAIISRFYYHLSKGEEKGIAMRHAKLDYLKNSVPAYANPYYWAAYEVLGDNSPIAPRPVWPLILIIVSILIAGGSVVLYFRRRRIEPARSL